MISLTSPIKTPAHDWPAGVKLALLGGATVVLFSARTIPPQLAGFVLMVVLYVLPGVEFAKAGWRAVRVIWPFVALMAAWHLVTADYEAGSVIVLRMMTAVGLANLVTMTTRLSDFIAVIRWITRPLRRVGLRAEALEIAIALVIRFTPVLVEKGQGLRMAWQARSTRRPGWRIVLPFTVQALDDADHVADALRARGGFQAMQMSDTNK
ncbi:energy-coupling factor transporter transmembrane component T family protein [Aliiroseovarius crassostreae]|uniref:energy-coupling factor transporter transmembrane component T family protein n=1 Tax=Aliiroseovarius crassostreae TaxID=154981 RepID=UPI0022087AAE|nr:energy-coupling factor transporter transmembrane component T [Aliiroseovarius crassostreae]UWP90790.1 energy-coupling factor transporter transmembrane protein EcfT [Aliiroseovarius crassostreae]